MHYQPNFPAATILYVEGNQASRTALAHLLRDQGFRVLEAGTGQEALQLAKERPDLILLDIHPPDADGFDLCAQFKATPATASTPVLLFSGVHVMSEDRVRGLEGGADGYLIKPVESAEVLAQIKALLRIRRGEEALARLAAIVESSEDAVIGKSLDGTITSWNAGAERLFGYTAKEAIGQPISILAWPGRPDEMPTILERIQCGERVEAFETIRVRKDGSRVAVSLSVSPVKDAAGQIVGAAKIARDISDRKRAEEETLRLARHIRLLMDSTGEGVYGIDTQGCCTFINRAASEMLGFDPEDVLGRNMHALIHHSRKDGSPYPPEECPILRAYMVGKPAYQDDEIIWRKDGTCFPVQYSSYPIHEEGIRGAVVTFNDITERRRLEEQFRQAQKMEAIGQLAGGVAHDFNNLLQVITGYGELLLETLRPDDPSRELVGEMTRAGERAAGLTRQLLAFSRQSVVAPRVLVLNSVIIDVEKMLRRVIGEDIDLKTNLRPGLGRVKADPGQIEQVVMNLAVNARDAMPQGGKLTIETQDAELDEEYARLHTGFRPGPYVLLAMSDTGHGMTPEVQAHIFEPFFTTKEKGKGTGLGLATVFGIVHQAGGHVAVYTEPGRGATFKVYLPRVEESVSPAMFRSGALPAPQGTETVLLVEDEDAVRALVRIVLQGAGYRVLEASDGGEALEVAGKHQGPIHLLLSDVVMPVLGGRELAERLLALHPEMKVLFQSGYTDDAVVRHGVLQEKVHFLQKPYSPTALARKVREVLDSPE